MWKAFAELEALGLIDSRRPRFVAVQSENTRPIVDAFEKHADDTTPVTAGKTIACGLNVPGGVGHFQVLKILYASEGLALAVSENAIRENLRAAFQQTGWWISPEGAATLAVLEELIDRRVIRPKDHVVAFNTGSAEKYLPEIRDLLDCPRRV